MGRSKNIAAKQQVAARLREIRKSTGMTQEKFAELLELSVSAYKKVESGENHISIECLRKIEQELRISSDYMLFGKQCDVDEAWKMLLNCSERDKMFLLLRLVSYFSAVRQGQYLTHDMQSICDEPLLNLLKEMDM